ncbi:MAG: hypothetical protein KC419_03945 [Anaerolineales bacterium]|nr:hypothetical protein [Anaerolineales bacterium]
MSKKIASDQHDYQITLEGRLDGRWADWFEGLTMTTNGDITILTGPVADQAALRGLLNQIWDFNLTVISVCRMEVSHDR